MKRFSGTLILLAAGLSVGCVERYITVKSRPAGAVVWLNGEEVGTTPVTTGFTWYGVYEVVLRKEGYQAVRTVHQTARPIYQWPVLDLFFEGLWPGTLVDRHEWQFQLQEFGPVDPNGLIERATELREKSQRY